MTNPYLMPVTRNCSSPLKLSHVLVQLLNIPEVYSKYSTSFKQRKKYENRLAQTSSQQSCTGYGLPTINLAGKYLTRYQNPPTNPARTKMVRVVNKNG